MYFRPPISSFVSLGIEDSAWLLPRAAGFQEIPQAMEKLKTYIVEDSRVIRENLIVTLEELAAVDVVGSAEDEFAATTWLKQPGNQVDLAIVDIFLKGGSGLGVLRSAQQRGSLYKLVVLSNYATPDMRRKCLELGADQVFDKSHDIDTLVQYCNRLAAGGSGNSSPGALQ